MIFLSRILGMIRRSWRCRKDFAAAVRNQRVFLHCSAVANPPFRKARRFLCEESGKPPFPLCFRLSSLSSPLPLVVFEQDKLPPSGNPKRRKEGEAQMTWERFELTGAVEDYLRYKGIDWKAEANAVSRVEGSAGNGAAKGRGTKGRETQHGTDDHGDGHRTGGLSLW